jgi:SAM-dependent methyltransferase
VQDLVLYQEPNSFDLALSVDVMEHILEDVEVFRNIHASLKDGGMLLISTPSDQGGSDVHADSETSFIEEHVRDGYNIHEIQQKLRTAGFERIEARYSYGEPGQISWRLSMKYPILMRCTWQARLRHGAHRKSLEIVPRSLFRSVFKRRAGGSSFSSSPHFVVPFQ